MSPTGRQANYLGSEVASSQATVQSLQARSRRTESLLRQEALFSYTDEVPAASSVAQFGGNLVELAAQRAYLSLTLGDVSATVVQLQSEQFQLGRALTTLRRPVPQRARDRHRGRQSTRPGHW